MSSDAGEDSARLHEPTNQKEEEIANIAVQLFRGHYTSEAPPQTDKHVDLYGFAVAKLGRSAAQGKDTSGFLPLHPFLPFDQPCLSLQPESAPLACMKWKV
jgi:hypothetical protein